MDSGDKATEVDGSFTAKAAEPERWNWAFCLEPELNLKIRRTRSSVWNLGPELELQPFER